jgi:hypothetical protein
MTVSAVAWLHSVSSSLLFGWRRRMAENGLEAVRADDDVVAATPCRCWNAVPPGLMKRRAAEAWMGLARVTLLAVPGERLKPTDFECDGTCGSQALSPTRASRSFSRLHPAFRWAAALRCRGFVGKLRRQRGWR